MDFDNNIAKVVEKINMELSKGRDIEEIQETDFNVRCNLKLQLIMQSIINKSADSDVECPKVTSSATEMSFVAQSDNDELKNEFSEFF